MLKSSLWNAELPGLLFGKHHLCDVILSELWLFVMSCPTKHEQSSKHKFRDSRKHISAQKTNILIGAVWP